MMHARWIVIAGVALGVLVLSGCGPAREDCVSCAECERRIEEILTLKLEIEQQLENALAARQALEAELEACREEIARLDGEVPRRVLRTGGPRLVRSGDVASDVPIDQPAHQGEVLSVDNEANVAIISLGSDDGVKPGFRYTVSRGHHYVAMIEITDVQATKAAGRSIRSLQKSEIQVGDRVMSR